PCSNPIWMSAWRSLEKGHRRPLGFVLMPELGVMWGEMLGTFNVNKPLHVNQRLVILRVRGGYRSESKYSVNPSPALAFSRSGGYSRPSWTTDQPPCSVSRPCGSQSRNWHPSPLVRHRIPRHRNPFVPPRLSPSAPVRFARG